MKLRKNGAHPAVKSDMRFWILCVCFLLGMAAAYPVRRSISTDALAQLGAYVQSYAQLADGRSPCVTAAYGFFLSFSVCCFAAALGRDGVLLALAALGLRCLFVLPCTLCLADAGFAQACRAMPRLRPRRLELNWRMLLFCVFVLLTGTVVECAIVPKFFALILARIA